MTSDDGLRIKGDSPCVDAGDNDAITGIDTDITGISRRINSPYVSDTGNGSMPIVDMGAYENRWFSDAPGFTFPPGPPRIAGGEIHTLVIKDDWTVWACGANGSMYSYFYGTLGTGSNSNVLIEDTLVPVWGGEMNMKYLEKIVLIDAGWPHSLAVDKDGFVWAWGGNYVGQVGDGTDIDRITPVKVNGGEMETDQLESIVKVAAGRSGEYSLACDGTGHVWAWGNNYIGQLGNGKDEGDYPPVGLQQK